MTAHPEREIRAPAVVVGRAAAAGGGAGAILGCLPLLPELIGAVGEGSAVDWGWLPIAAGVGAVVGALTAVIASAGWLVAIGRAPDRVRRARVIAAVCAFFTVDVLSLFALSAATWFGVGAAAVAGVICYLVAPHLGLGRREHRRTAM